MFFQGLLSHRVKQSSIIINKHDTYELRHELFERLQFYDLRNKERSRKYQNFVEL